MNIFYLKRLLLFTLLCCTPNQSCAFSLNGIWQGLKQVCMQLTSKNKPYLKKTPLLVDDELPFQDENSCCICFENLYFYKPEAGYIPISLPCPCKGNNKSIHLKCLTRIIAAKPKCPTCRTDIDQNFTINITELYPILNQERKDFTPHSQALDIRTQQVKVLQEKYKHLRAQQAPPSLQKIKKNQDKEKQLNSANRNLNNENKRLKKVIAGLTLATVTSALLIGWSYSKNQ